MFVRDVDNIELFQPLLYLINLSEGYVSSSTQQSGAAAAAACWLTCNASFS
jgi:hypothetical protein